jgi:NAD(P)-dependent dehydrogenase (short-subunit alcohol dehydrogenase family)
MRGLQGRTYIVTGASSGIGRATAVRLLSEGARVMGADIADAPTLPESESPDPMWAFSRCDVSDEDSVQQLVRDAVTFGGTSPDWSMQQVWRVAARCTCCRPRSGTVSSP